MPARPTLRVLLLAAIVALFAVSSFVNYQQHLERSRFVAFAQKQGAWAASELENELLKLNHALELLGLGQRTTAETMLRFDLLWSRVEVLRVGTETQEVRELLGGDTLLNDLLGTLQRIEPRLQTLAPGDRAGARRLLETLAPFTPRVRAFNVDSFSGPQAQQRIGKVFEIQSYVSLSMAGLVISGALLILMLIRESARNRRQSLHDSLTGLPNRQFFNEQLQFSEARCRRLGSRLGILVIDLNNFKEINDTLGHHCGDLLLKEIATRLRGCIRAGEVVARLGGDEFAVIQAQVNDAESCVQLARRICERIGQPAQIDGNPVYPSASIGVSVYPEDADSARQVLINADMAMYRAKSDSGISYRLFEPEMNASLRRRAELAEDLRKALGGDRLVLNYQPIVRLASGLIESVEALLRWHHPKYGYVPPPEVVSIAEQYGLARELNEWVIAEACRQHRRWCEAGLPPLQMAVNVSPAMYTQHDLCASLTRILDDTGMPPSWLCVEVTEDTTMRDIETSPDTMMHLKRLGVQIALDDFGTGYSSLSHLKRLPVDKLKIDRSFVQDLNNLPKDLRFVRSIVSLARSLDLEIVAEGIEFQQNLDDLQQEGCQFGQGYLFSRALSAGKLATLLRNQQARGAALTCSNYGGIGCLSRPHSSRN